MGVHDPNGLLIEEMDDWLREVKAQLAGDKLGILRETIESWLKRWTIRYITHVLAMVQDLQRGHLSGHVRLNMLQMILEHNKGHVLDASPQRESTAYAFSAYNPLGDETLSLAVTCPSSLNQSLVDTVTPVEVVNYFCEMCIDEQHYFCEHGLFKSNLTSGKQIPICSDTLTHGTSPSLKEVGRQNLFGPWPTGIHLPLKMANVVLFRDKTSHLPSELLSYQTCDKFFVPDKSYT